MAKRLTIPKTNAEAEQFLWHALFHVTGEAPVMFGQESYARQDFRVIIQNAIHLVTCDELGQAV